MSGIAGLRGTGDMGTDERPKNFRESILFRNPEGSAPIFALTARAGKMSVDDPEFSWWDEPNDIIRLQSAASHAASETTITVDSADPDSTTPDRVWGTATHLKPGDQLLVEPATDSATYNNEVIEVVSVISDTQFVVRRGVQGTTAATISNDLFLTKIGSAYAEGTSTPQAVSRNPIKYSNYTQIFKNTYELTGTIDETRLRTGSARSNDKKRKIFDHSRDIEMAFLFGRSSETTGDNGKPKRTMAGLRAQIPTTRQHVFSANFDINDFLDQAYKVFDFESPAGNSRIAFCGNGALNAMNKGVQADANSEIRYEGTFKEYGMQMTKLVIPQGVFWLKTHPLLSRNTLYTNSMFIVDFSALKYVPMKNRDTKIKDDVQSRDEDVRRGFLQTECSLRVDFGGLTCAYLGGFQYSA